MTRVEFAAGAQLDLERLLEHLLMHGVADAGARIADLVAAIDILQRHPRIGRPAGADLRELVIGKDSRGYVALYAYRPLQDVVRVVALRAQREAGYATGRTG